MGGRTAGADAVSAARRTWWHLEDSPRVPTEAEVSDLVARALAVLPAERVWVNPDCGLKTRTYPQVEAALTAVVAAAHHLRGSRVGG